MYFLAKDSNGKEHYLVQTEGNVFIDIPKDKISTEESSTVDQTCETCKHYHVVSVECDRCDKDKHSRYERSE